MLLGAANGGTAIGIPGSSDNEFPTNWLQSGEILGFFFSGLGIPNTFGRPLDEFCRMRARRDATLRLIKTMVASIVIPAAIFSQASRINFSERLYRGTELIPKPLIPSH